MISEKCLNQTVLLAASAALEVKSEDKAAQSKWDVGFLLGSLRQFYTGNKRHSFNFTVLNSPFKK